MPLYEVRFIETKPEERTLTVLADDENSAATKIANEEKVVIAVTPVQ